MNDGNLEALLQALPGVRLWKLDGHMPVPCATPEEYVASKLPGGTFSLALCHVGRIIISTIFVGIDDGRSNPPLLFETMAFRPGEMGDPPKIFWRQRRATWEEAMQEHETCVASQQLAQGPSLH